MLYNPFRAHVVRREEKISRTITYSVRRRYWFGWQFASISWPVRDDGKVSWSYTPLTGSDTKDLNQAYDLLTRIRTNYYPKQAKENRRRELGQPISMDELGRMTLRHRLQNGYQPENSNHDLSGSPSLGDE